MDKYVNFKSKSGKQGKRRLNPETGQFFKKGDSLEDGSVFISYDSNLNKSGVFVEKWKRPKNYVVKRKTESVPREYKKRRYYYDIFERTVTSKKYLKDTPFDLDEEYLREIYPEDMCCPIIGIEMVDGGCTDTRPELDRIIPEKGYVKGNVAWISGKANRIKSDYTKQELSDKIRILQNLIKYIDKNNS